LIPTPLLWLSNSAGPKHGQAETRSKRKIIMSRKNDVFEDFIADKPPRVAESDVIPPFNESRFLAIVALRQVPIRIIAAARERLIAHREAYELVQSGGHPFDLSLSTPGDNSRRRAEASRQPLPAIEDLESIHSIIRQYYEKTKNISI